MGSYGSLGSAGPYLQAGSEGAIGASVGGSIDVIKDGNKKKQRQEDDNDQNTGEVYYYNGNKIDTRPYRPKKNYN